MKIKVTQLKENQVVFLKESVSPEQIDLDTPEIKYSNPIIVSTEAKKECSVVHAKTHVSASAVFICSRCLNKYTNAIEKDFAITYPLNEIQHFIDITEDIREEMIAHYPVKFLCQPECKGLCPQCGKNLNEERCNCTRQ